MKTVTPWGGREILAELIKGRHLPTIAPKRNIFQIIGIQNSAILKLLLFFLHVSIL